MSARKLSQDIRTEARILEPGDDEFDASIQRARNSISASPRISSMDIRAEDLSSGQVPLRRPDRVVALECRSRRGESDKQCGGDSHSTNDETMPGHALPLSP